MALMSIFAAIFSGPGVFAAENPVKVSYGQEYTIGPGDILLVSVWKDEALTRTMPVRPDGMITFPLIGELKAGGETTANLQSEIEKRISKFVPEPYVTVAVQEIKSLIVYVIGRVNNPGRFAVGSDMNVLQALATAGGCNAFAKRSEIRIFRRIGESTRLFQFDYDRVSKGENLEDHILLLRGDVIVVP
jgi:polysaccharide export outer membrane protein